MTPFPDNRLELEPKLAGALAARALQAAHGCRDGCPACELEAEAARLPRPDDFRRFLRSDAALRIGVLVADYGQPFPRLAEDDLTQLLVVEATMARFAEERRLAVERHERELDAKAKTRAFAEGRR